MYICINPYKFIYNRNQPSWMAFLLKSLEQKPLLRTWIMTCRAAVRNEWRPHCRQRCRVAHGAVLRPWGTTGVSSGAHRLFHSWLSNMENNSHWSITKRKVFAQLIEGKEL